MGGKKRDWIRTLLRAMGGFSSPVHFEQTTMLLLRLGYTTATVSVQTRIPVEYFDPMITDDG
jgi:hypothetical protein